MPSFRITAPDGKTYQVTAPDGATKEQVLAYVQQQHNTGWQPTRRSAADLQANAAQYQAAHPVTADMNFGQTTAAGAGKSVIDTLRGIDQLYAAGADAVAPRPQNIGGLVSGQDNSRTAEAQAMVDQSRNEDAALMNTVGGNVGNIGGQIAQLAIPVGDAVKGLSWAGKAAPYIAQAAKMGTFASLQPTATGESRAVNTGVGAVLGPLGEGASQVVSKVSQGAVSRLTPIAQRLAQKADALGIPLNMTQLSTNPLVRTVASQMERLPFSGAGKRTAAQQEGFNRAVGRTFGANVPQLTQEAFDVAKTRLSNGFNAVASRNKLPLSYQLQSDMSVIQDEANRLASPQTAAKITGWINELTSKANANGVIPGRAYQSIDSRIGSAMKFGGEDAHYLGMLRDSIRSAMDDAISPKDKAAWQALRQQWGNMKTVEPLVGKATEGNISPQLLMGRVNAGKANAARMATGKRGELGDLAQIGKRFLQQAPNSGTADRLLVNLGLGGGLYGLQHEGVISPEHAAEVAALLLANRAGAKVLNSKLLTQGGESKILNGLARLVKSAPTSTALTLRPRNAKP